MPCGQIKFGGRVAHLTVVGDFKPGDHPPSGYVDWQEWARVQHKAGLRQQQCGKCGLWRFPQELSEEFQRWTAQSRRGQAMQVIAPLCIRCAPGAPWPFP